MDTGFSTVVRTSCGKKFEKILVKVRSDTLRKGDRIYLLNNDCIIDSISSLILVQLHDERFFSMHSASHEYEIDQDNDEAYNDEHGRFSMFAMIGDEDTPEITDNNSNLPLTTTYVTTRDPRFVMTFHSIPAEEVQIGDYCFYEAIARRVTNIVVTSHRIILYAFQREDASTSRFKNDTAIVIIRLTTVGG